MNSSCLSRKSQFLFFASLFVVLHRHIRADIPYNDCADIQNYIANSTFQFNLDNLLNSLASNASVSNFWNGSIGDDEDRVFGNFLCYATVSSTRPCQSCVTRAVDYIKQVCSTKMEAIVWMEDCQLRYSNQSFFGVMEYTKDIPQWNNQTIPNPNGFRVVVRDLLQNLSNSAAFNPSSNGYALGDHKNFNTEDQTLYGLVQCTRDLSSKDCNRCLQTAISKAQKCCYMYMGARILSKSCYLRYELYPLLQEAEVPSQIKKPSKSEPRKLSFAIIITIAALAVVVVLLCSCVYYSAWGKGTKNENVEARTPKVSLHDVVTPTNSWHHSMRQRDEMEVKDIPVISFSTIHEVTNNFSYLNILGQGGFGPVYKGVLPDGKEVAIKRLSVISEQGSEEFMNEILLIMKLQHKNLVKLLGCCIEGEEKILIYEYMPNRSLNGFIFDSEKRAQLDWQKRLNIITGIARGLLYLHQDSRLRIIHRDLKAGNVLLDENLNPKISDFGMARIFGGNIGEANTNIIVGTYGYMAPEYAMEGLYSIKSDVFSFGVLLIEIVTGKRNAGFHLSRRAPSLLQYAWGLWNEGRGLELMDPLLTESCLTIQFLRCIHIGLLCVQEDATMRPNMSSVIIMLGNEGVPLRQPQTPAFSVGRLVGQCDQALSCTVNELTISSVSPR